MAEKGRRDKGRRETKKKAKRTIKEKRRDKREKTTAETTSSWAFTEVNKGISRIGPWLSLSCDHLNVHPEEKLPGEVEMIYFKQIGKYPLDKNYSNVRI